METATNIIVIAKAALKLIGSDAVQEIILGRYSNGELRSVPDMLHGEFLSPKEKKKILYGDTKKRKKNKKGSKKRKSKRVKFQL